MKAVVLAGGLGTRLHPLTVDLPKPMIPLANRPLLAYLVEYLERHGFREIHLLLYHQPEVIRDYFKDGSRFNVRITYHEALEDYGTAGAVRFACGREKEPLLVISADLITDVDLDGVIDFHRGKNAAATMVLYRTSNPLPYGIVIRDEDARIKQFLEKPSWGEVFSDTINAGIYVVEPEVMGLIPSGKNFDFSLDLFPRLLKQNFPFFGYVAEGYWKDIGKIEEYARTHHDVISGKVKLNLPPCKNRGDFLLQENVSIAASAIMEGSGLIGEGSVVAEQAALSHVVLGKNCKIARGAFLKECILWDGAQVGSEARLERVIVGRDVKIGSRVNIGEGVVVGDECEIGSESDIRPFIKIWPRKIIGQGSTVSRSIIWRERWAKAVFGQYGVSGIYNVELTPQFAVALGAAYGSILGKGARISCSSDSHKASRLIYRALIAGALSTGIDISNLEMVPIPLNRFDISSLKSVGGFHVRRSPFDPEVLDIKFFDEKGMDLSSAAEKKIERIFLGEDFTRSGMDGAGELTNPFYRVAESYKEAILEQIDEKLLRASNLKVVIDYSFGSASQIFPSILGEFGLEVISLNAHIDETRIAKDKETFEKALCQMIQIVRSVGADLGVMLDTGAEKIFICDEEGRLVDGDRALALMALMVLRSRKNAAIAVPVKESSAVDRLAEKYQGRVIRTKNSFRGMMEIAAGGGASFLGEGEGGYIFPEFMPSFDGMLSVCKILEYLAGAKTTLAELAAEIPSINRLGRDIPCSADQKGMIMRRAAEAGPGADRIETIDGLKFWHGGDWVLVLPDSARPVLHLIAEAGSARATRLLLEKYQKMVTLLKERGR